MSTFLIQKEPFKDSKGDWWIYRSDDPNMHSPLGPFFTAEYAASTEAIARKRNAPMPMSFGRRQPKLARR
jgi:hypothetical protein